VATQGLEIGAGWVRKSECSGNDYASLGLAAAEFRTNGICNNLQPHR
jgi:uncharacterized protein (DUF736 family)